MLYTCLGKTGVNIPRIGQGTWTYGERKSDAAEEEKALRFGLENGLTLIDTAEEYGNEALGWELTPEDLAEMDAVFPKSSEGLTLQMY